MVNSAGSTMRAAVFYGQRDIRIEDVPVPTPADDQALLRVLRSGLCGTDVSEWTSGPIMIPLEHEHPHSHHKGPMIPGHEIVAEVVTAPDGSGLEPGMVVASGAQIFCHECRNCRQGRINVCERLYTLGLQVDGGHAEFVVSPVANLVPVPDGLAVDAAGLAQPLAVGLHAARRAGAVAGDRVLVTGAGAIGSFVVAGLRHIIPDLHITVSDIDDVKLERARRLGADEVLNTRTGGEPEAEGFDVVIEASGAPGLLIACFGYCRTGGRVLAVGMSAKPLEFDPHAIVLREITLETTNALVTPVDIPDALEILASGNVASEMLDSVRSLDAVPSALDELAAGTVQGKILIDPRR
ncbi:zinc-binding dehydrogenase [Cryobacterium sp. BB736]|uniref:zinc-dependent alcohol dehydrogenase n=1 Tax=Cryobacterium sp. BB736 TaxID=2746963 RepID=UPI001D0BEADF|nr:alcohol dehydrogenase catalytic domain-containing protein [Cryobacterium sp. BB736]